MLVRPAASPAGLTTANRMFPICARLKDQNSGTPEFWWSIFFASSHNDNGFAAKYHRTHHPSTDPIEEPGLRAQQALSGPC